MKEPIPFPSDRQRVLVDDPLYTSYGLAALEDGKLEAFFKGSGAVDAYCVECKRPSVFRHGDLYVSKDEEIKKFGVLIHTSRCSRADFPSGSERCSGELVVCFLRSLDKMTKIGQWPSRADLDFGSLDPRLQRELDKVHRDELGRAIGLRAHDVGIGSFVYLRRIFESLLAEAEEEAAVAEEDWDEHELPRKRVKERVQRVSAYLPSRLVKTTQLYSVLSKGIHELTEEVCLNHFDLLLKSILMILQQRLDEKEFQKLTSELEQTASELEQSS